MACRNSHCWSAFIHSPANLPMVFLYAPTVYLPTYQPTYLSTKLPTDGRSQRQHGVRKSTTSQTSHSPYRIQSNVVCSSSTVMDFSWLIITLVKMLLNTGTPYGMLVNQLPHLPLAPRQLFQPWPNQKVWPPGGGSSTQLIDTSWQIKDAVPSTKLRIHPGWSRMGCQDLPSTDSIIGREPKVCWFKGFR